MTNEMTKTLELTKVMNHSSSKNIKVSLDIIRQLK